MSDRDKPRIVALQKQVAIARKALLRIREYEPSSHTIAGTALEEMESIDAASKPDHTAIHETRFRGLKAWI